MIAKGLRLCLPALVVAIGLGAWGYLATDPAAHIPDNWGLNAKSEVSGDPVEAFLMLPAFALLVTFVMAAAPLMDKRGSNLRLSETAYLTTWSGILYFIALIQGGLTLRAVGIWRGSDYGSLIPLWACGFSILVILLGNVLGKSRPNWFIGVRTPWTMSSDWTWERTHRFAGRSFVAVGLVCLLIAVAVSANEAMLALTLGVTGASLASAAYPYAIWRRAPDRRASGSPTRG